MSKPPPGRPKIRVEGNHSLYHCGSAAAFSTLKRICETVGDISRSEDDFDILVMNGEGSMHNGSKSFHAKMKVLRDAQLAGKRTFLVNSVWQENPSDYDDVLRKLDGIQTRGLLSKLDLLQRHGVEAGALPDAAYWETSDGIATDFQNGMVVSDIYSMDLRGFVWSAENFPDARKIDMKQWQWADLVSSLRTAGLFITGRHHGMYAACKARVPFVVFRCNSHKIEDLIEMAGVKIPICTTFRAARNLPCCPRCVSVCFKTSKRVAQGEKASSRLAKQRHLLLVPVGG